MTDIIWPVSLPQHPRKQGYKETYDDHKIKTQMSAGPSQKRRITTAGSRYLEMSFRLTQAQRVTLRDFYFNTLKSGTLTFQFTHPIDGDLLICQMDDAPVFTLHRSGLYFYCPVKFEVRP